MLRLIPKPVKLLARLPGIAWRSMRIGNEFGLEAGLTMFTTNAAFWSIDPAQARQRLVGVRVRGYAHPIYVRTHTSDAFVVDQVIFRQEYRSLTSLKDPKLIIDCGANIGCTSLYLLTRFPNARLIALEPDRGNCEVCAHNLRGFGSRAEILQAGVWSHEASLRVERGGYRDGREWSFQVRECTNGEPGEVKGVSISSLLSRTDLDQIDILKIDIEGAEAVLFSQGCHDWLARTNCLAIEIHNEACRRAVLGALSQHPFDTVHVRETLFCFRRAA